MPSAELLKQKEQYVKELTEKLKGSAAGVLVDYKGITVADDRKTEFGRFYRFDVLTLVPYEKALIDISLLTREEINQINCYHEMVRKALSPYLEGRALSYLEDASSPIADVI